MLARALLLVAAAVSTAMPAQAQDASRPDASAQQEGIERGRDASRLLLSGDRDALAARMSADFLAAVDGLEGLASFLENVRNTLGAELAIEQEVAFREGRVTQYFRRGRFEKLPDATIFWAIDDAGVLRGGTVRPTRTAAPSSHLDYHTKAALRLPFGAPRQGRWYVGWGGRDVIHNYHVTAPDQRFAYDLYVTVDGRPFHNDGTKVEDYYCFGEPILAPAAGTVVAAVDGLPDNPPRQLDREHPVGNYVIIDHGGEFSILAHFMNGSVAVKPQDIVSAGQLLGRCGNSGNSTMPHLHYHLQATPVFRDAVGLPAQFNGYRADGVLIERGEPLRGQFLEP